MNKNIENSIAGKRVVSEVVTNDEVFHMMKTSAFSPSEILHKQLIDR